MPIVKEIETKIVSHTLLEKRISQLRTVSKTIVMCYGSFDLYHIGHIDLLEQAKRYGDALIVVVTKDESGTNVIDERSRMIQVASHEHVDYVTNGSELEVIDLIKPNVVVTSYSEANPPHKKLPGIAESVKSYEGKFVTIPRRHNISKNDIMNRIFTLGEF